MNDAVPLLETPTVVVVTDDKSATAAVGPDQPGSVAAFESAEDTKVLALVKEVDRLYGGAMCLVELDELKRYCSVQRIYTLKELKRDLELPKNSTITNPDRLIYGVFLRVNMTIGDPNFRRQLFDMPMARVYRAVSPDTKEDGHCCCPKALQTRVSLLITGIQTRDTTNCLLAGDLIELERVCMSAMIYHWPELLCLLACEGRRDRKPDECLSRGARLRLCMFNASIKKRHARKTRLSCWRRGTIVTIIVVILLVVVGGPVYKAIRAIL